PPQSARERSATSRNQEVRALDGYLDSLRRRADSDALEAALASSLCGVGPRTVSRLRAYARERSRPLKKAVDRVMYSLAARDPDRYPLPWGQPPSAGREQGAALETPPEPDFMPFLPN